MTYEMGSLPERPRASCPARLSIHKRPEITHNLRFRTCEGKPELLVCATTILGCGPEVSETECDGGLGHQ